MIDKIHELARAQQELAKQAVKAYMPIVNDIIQSKNTNENQIESILDYMLSFCFDDDMLILFKKLCRYYFSINPEATAFYVNQYRQMWDDDSKSEE